MLIPGRALRPEDRKQPLPTETSWCRENRGAPADVSAPQTLPRCRHNRRCESEAVAKQPREVLVSPNRSRHQSARGLCALQTPTGKLETSCQERSERGPQSLRVKTLPQSFAATQDEISARELLESLKRVAETALAPVAGPKVFSRFEAVPARGWETARIGTARSHP